MKVALLFLIAALAGHMPARGQDSARIQEEGEFTWLAIRVHVLSYQVRGLHAARPGSIYVRDVVECEIVDGERKGDRLQLTLTESQRPENPELLRSATAEIPDVCLERKSPDGSYSAPTRDGLRDVVWREKGTE